jgi:FKBP-type peptidyl-prolyl cis-trans isomerase FklB
MKSAILALAAAGLLAVPLHADSNKDDVSYGLGVSIGNAWKRQGLESEQVNLEQVKQGIADAISGGVTRLSDDQLRELMTNFGNEMRTRQQERRQEQGQKNKSEGAAFLEENKRQPGVQTTASGLQYNVVTEGSGPSPSSADTVVVHYRGTLIDGTEFDSSHRRGQPATFGVGQVIPGWTEALQMMKVGGKRRLFIPSELAYGERGQGNIIGPNAVLVFEVELIDIQKPSAPSNDPVTSDIIKVPSAEELKRGAKIEVIKPEDLKKLQQQQPK